MRQVSSRLVEAYGLHPNAIQALGSMWAGVLVLR
jgi:hypothetical protein